MVIIASWVGWQKTNLIATTGYSKSVSVSVIIAARNEDKNIPNLLSDLKQQTYSKTVTEWIIVDDHSNNKISDLPCFINNKPENLIIVELENNKNGKKEALKVGVDRSNGELLIFTDADCWLNTQWIESIVTQYEINKPAIIIGLVNYHNQKGFLAQFFKFDLISLVITGAGLTSIGFPVICNGANLAVRRDIYLKNIQSVRPEIASGDDVFLLHAIKKNKNARFEVIKSKESVVMTRSPSNLLEFLDQRTRWASKSWSYSDKSIIFLAVTVLLTNLGLAVVFVTSLIANSYYNLFYLFFIKVTADCFIITTGLSFFGKKRNFFLFPFFSLIYPFYFLLVFILSLKGAFTWKDRVIKTG